MPSALEAAVARFDARLARRELEAVRTMTRVYAQAWARVRAAAEALARRAALGGGNVTGLATRAAWQEDFARLIQAELRRFAQDADPLVRQLASEALSAGQQDAVSLAQLVGGRGAPLLRMPSRRAVEALVGATSEGSPLATVLAEMAAGSDGVAAQMADTLAAGMTEGLGPRVIARQLRDDFGAPLYRSLLVARTEMQRAYNGASLATYRENDDLIEAWARVSACDASTCPACWAEHGSIHPLSEPFDEHPGGRCRAAPVLKDARNPTITPGPERLAAASEDVQRRVLGPARFAAYQDGALSLADLSVRQQSAAWGPHVAVRPLADLVGTERAAGYISAARTGAVDAATSG